MQPSFYSRLWPATLILMAVVTLYAFHGSRQAMKTQSNRVEDWLPAEFQETQDLYSFLDAFGGDDLLMISWEGCTLEDPRVDELAETLRRPVDLGEQRGLKIFRDVITANDVLLDLEESEVDLDEEEALEKLAGTLVGPADADGQRAACVVVLITETGWKHRFRMLDHIYACANHVEGLSADSIHVAGPTINGIAIDRASEESVNKSLWLCFTICVVITLVCFRSITLMLMVVVSAEINRMLTLALVYYAGSSMDSILLVAPSLVSVLSISTAVHLVNYYRDSVHEGGLDGAVVRAVKQGWTPCVLATATTALGLISLLVSFLVPIKKFGVFGTGGLLIGTGLLFLFLPTLLLLYPPRRWTREAGKKRVGDVGIAWRGLHATVSRSRGPIVVATIILLAVGVWGATRIESSARIGDMLPEEHRVLQDYAWLEERVGPLVPLEVVVNVPAPEVNDEGKFSGYPMLERMRLIRRLEQSLAEIEGVDAVVSAATFAPNLHPKRERVIWRVRVNRELSKHRSDYVESGVLRESPTGDLWRISARVKASRKHDYVLLHEQLKKQINGAIADREDQTLAVNDVMITGSIPVVQKSQEQVLKDLFSSYATALLLIAIAMTALLRSIPAGLVSMIPNAFPAIVIFGMLGWFGVKIEVGSMMTATVAMGIAVDDTLHFLTWFRRGLLAGLSRDDAVKSAYDRCGVAMIQTTLICGLGLLVFVVSPFGPISRFSWLMFAMLSTALVGDLIVLPAILLSPLGALFTPRVKKDEHREHREKECEEEEEAVREAPRPHMAQRRSITA